jgi:hypothetical protein
MQHGAKRAQPQPGSSLPRQVLDDIRHGNLRREVGRDLTELYGFFLDEEQQLRAAAMSRPKRWIMVPWWALKSLLRKLPAPRRVMLVLALVFALFGETRISAPNGSFSIGGDLQPLSIALLLVILMLELKDKLVARDEIEVARQVQLALLPRRQPALEGWDIWLYTRPANDVGGDLVDFLDLPDRRLALALGDVSGKGMGAALLMAKLQATLRALVPLDAALADLGAYVNQILCRDGVENRYATLLYAELGADSGRIRLLNAGHLLPLIVRAGASERLAPVAMPLGMFREAAFAEQEVELGADDMLVLYSDGLSEAQDPSGQFFGESRLVALAPALRRLAAAAAGAVLLEEIERFLAGTRPADDLSLAIVRRVA